MERDAKLFEAGEYPDRGLTVTEAHLDQMVQAFTEPAPVLLEHLAGGWVVGSLTRVWRRGAELFGRVQLLPEAAALIQRLGIRGLSVGLASDLQRILEVSVTAAPRVADARLWSDACRFPASWADADLPESAVSLEAEGMQPADPEPPAAEDAPAESTEHAEEADTLLRRWMQQGRLTPAAAPFARALLGASGALVRFGETQQNAAQLFRQYMEAMPTLDLYSERSRTDADEEPPFTEDQREWLRRYWGDMPWETLARAARERQEATVWRR